MDFSFDDDDLALRDAVRRFCDDAFPANERGDPLSPQREASLRTALTDLGLFGLALPEAVGGSGLGPVQTMVVAQEFGRALATGAWFASAAIAAPLLAEAASPEQQRRWLPRAAAGTSVVTLACHEHDARYDASRVLARARRHGDGWQIDGCKTLVLEGDTADLLLVVARTDGEPDARTGLTLLAVERCAPGVSVAAHATLEARRIATLSLDRVAVAATDVVGPVGGAWPLVERGIDRAVAAVCADSAGALEAMLELTAEHLRTRRQFGAPLATFQVLQHRVADLAIALEQLKSMACAAALALQPEVDAQRPRLVSAAKELASRLGRECAFTAIQLHGAMGMTDEARVSHYARRLIANGQWFGDASHHLRRFMSHPDGGHNEGDIG
ncbi:MAG: acyl-CoA dehydrogenase family protein [Lautropia sp.]